MYFPSEKAPFPKYRVDIKSLDHFNRLKKIEKPGEKILIWCQKTRYVLKFYSELFIRFFDLFIKCIIISALRKAQSPL